MSAGFGCGGEGGQCRLHAAHRDGPLLASPMAAERLRGGKSAARRNPANLPSSQCARLSC
jgi:hypothetical protein